MKFEGLKAGVLVLLLVIILSAAIVFLQFSKNFAEQSIPKEQQAMNLIKEDKVFKQYIEGKGFQQEILLRSAEEVKKLNEEYGFEFPEKEIYQINFTHKTLGNFTAFVDLENKTEKIYRLTGVTLK